MSLLSICTNAANNCGVDVPSSIVGNSDPAAMRLLQLARRAAKSLAKRADWTELVTEYTFTADGSSDYALPPDFRSIVDNTMWDRTRFWRMRGAMSPQQWQMYKSSIIGRATIERRWRIRLPSGAVAGAPRVFSIDPAIGSTDTSSQFVFEYVSDHWCRSIGGYQLDEAIPVAAGTGYAVGDFITLAGGTFSKAATLQVTSLTTDGADGVATSEVVTPGLYTVKPTTPAAQGSTTGSGSGATFLVNTTTFEGAGQSDWAADTDVAILDEDMIELGVIWRLLSRIGLAYAEERDEYEREVDKLVARDGGTAILDLAPYDHLTLIGPYNVPETGFGGTPS